MGNGFTGPPAADFYNQLSGLGETLQQNAVLRQKQQILEARKGAFSDFTALDPSSPDYGRQALTVAQKLGSVGDQEGALKFIGLAQTAAQTAQATARDQRDFGFRQTEAQRAQGNADRTFTASQEPKAVLKTVKDLNGNESIVRVNPDNTTVPIDTGQGPAANPFSYGKMNETQSKDSGYANRMFRAEGVLRDPKVIEAGKSVWEATKEGVPLVPDFVKNWAHTPEYQKYDQSQRDFINAVLRRESGAAISQSEFDNAYKQYIPRPGDSSEKLAEKQKNRQDTLAGIAGGGGPSYKPPFTFGPNGELVPTGNAKQGATPAPVQPKAAAVTAPPQAIAALKKDPRLIAQFEAKYGKGSAKAILGGAPVAAEEE